MKLRTLISSLALSTGLALFACESQDGGGGSNNGGNGGSATGGRGGSGGGGTSSGGSGGTAQGGSGGGGSGGGGAGGAAQGGSGGTSAGAGGAGGSSSGGSGGSAAGGASGSGSGGSGGPVDAAGEAAPAAGIDLLGMLQKTLFKITVTTFHPVPKSGTYPNNFANQMNADTFRGDPSKTYDVTFRVRGLTEPRLYTGGMADPASPFVQVGGMPSNASGEHGRQYGVFKIEVSNPQQTYFLNKDHMMLTDHEVYKLEYDLKVKVKGGAMVSIVFADLPNSGAITNHRNMVIDGVPAEVIMQPFKDQFLYVVPTAVVEAAP